MTNLTQLQRIKYKLRKDKMITRNQCLRVVPAITRLSAYILDLKNEGWKFKTEDSNGDYKYYLIDCPPEQIKLL